MCSLDTLYSWQFFSILENKIAIENPSEDAEFVNQKIAEYTGLIKAGAVVLNLPLQGITSVIMRKFGIFACSLNLPLVMLGCAVVFNSVTDMNALLASRSVYNCFYLLNFGFVSPLRSCSISCVCLASFGSANCDSDICRHA